MDRLRLDGVDTDDLAILAAHCQDALARVGECQFLPGEQRFVLALNRFVWERAVRPSALRFWAKPEYERRRAVLQFERVGAVQRTGFSQGLANQVLSLMTLRFVPGAAPSGAIELVFAGGSAIRLDVECIEARLTDLDAAWSTTARPDHERDEAAGG